MSALSLIGQFSTYPVAVLAGGAGDGVADVLISQVVPAGTYIGNIIVEIVGAGVTTGRFFATFDGVNVLYTITGANGVDDTALGTFFFTSDGTTPLIVSAVGVGGAWTSSPTTLYLRQIA
jgi:hypothetical protein